MVQSLGYKPKLSSASTTDIDVFQTVPSLSNKPNYLRYGLL